MAEDGNAAAPVVETPAAPATPPTPEAAALMDIEGNLQEGWTNILPEDLRDNSFLKETKTIQGMARSVVSARGMVGRDKIPIPTEASSEAEWDAFYVAGGRPTTKEDYNATRPEELAEEHYSQEFADGAMEILFKFGASKKLADALFEYNNNFVIAQLAKNTQDKELSATQLKDGLYSDWGNAFEQKKHLGNVAVEQGTNGDADFKERLTQKFGNDPDFIRFSANLGSKFSEAGSPEAKQIPTPGDIQTQIDTEQANPAYGPDYLKHGFSKSQHKTQVNKVQQLFNAKMASETKTG